MRAISAVAAALACLLAVGAVAADLPTDERGAIEYLAAKGVEISRNDAGHAIRLASTGTPPLTPEEYAVFGLLSHLKVVGLNGARLADDEWGFLDSLPKLEQLSVWHSHEFATLEPFSGLPVKSLTVGGCVGLRDKNKDDVQKQRDVVLTLHDLPNVERLVLYHVPLVPDDAHLRHIAASFPKLEELRIDVLAPKGTETTITPAGIAELKVLPLAVLNLENARSFGPEHFEALARIASLRALLIDARKHPVPDAGIAAFRKLRPDVEVVVAQPGDAAAPRVKPKDR